MSIQNKQNTNINNRQTITSQDETTQEILNSLLKIGYQEKGENDFVVEILGEENEEIKQIATQLNNQIRTISNDEFKRIAAPITMRVVSVNSDGTINVNKPTDKTSKDHCWTRIPNPTIFQYLEAGDEVLLGYYEGVQKSNCWVMFAKVSNKEMNKKSVYKDIDKLYTINDNTKILKRWMHTVILEVYPDIERTGTDSQGNKYTYYVPHPTRLQFEREMRQQWKEVIK